MSGQDNKHKRRKTTCYVNFPANLDGVDGAMVAEAVSRGKSKYRGVSWNGSKCKWRAQIYLNGKNTYLGWFENEEDAARKYDEYASLRASGTIAVGRLQPKPAKKTRADIAKLPNKENPEDHKPDCDNDPTAAEDQIDRKRDNATPSVLCVAGTSLSYHILDSLPRYVYNKILYSQPPVEEDRASFVNFSRANISNHRRRNSDPDVVCPVPNGQRAPTCFSAPPAIYKADSPGEVKFPENWAA